MSPRVSIPFAAARVAALVLALAAVGCVATADSTGGLTPVSGPDTRYELDLVGVAVHPPSGEHWYVQQSGRRQIAFVTSPLLDGSVGARPTQADTAHTLVAMVLEVVPLEPGLDDPAALHGFVERWLQGGGGMRELAGSTVALDPTPQQRTRLVEARVRVDELGGAPCVRFDAVLEERGHPEHPDQVLVTVIRDNRLVRHPDSPDPLYVLSGCSERFLAQHRPQPLLLDGRAGEMAGFAAGLELFPPSSVR